jgi:ATP-dependent 26S proteasome regulatory subunit
MNNVIAATSVNALLPLSPAQQECFESALLYLQRSQLVSLWGPTGKGISLILRHVHARLGGTLLTAKDLIAPDGMHPLALEEWLRNVLVQNLKTTDLLIIDDLSLFLEVISQDSTLSAFPRKSYGRLVGQMLSDFVNTTGKQVLTRGSHNWGTHANTLYLKAPEFKAVDYQHICRTILGNERTQHVEFDRIFHYAQKLDGHDLRKACNWLMNEPSLTTQQLLDYFQAKGLSSNVDLNQVAPVEFSDLKGMDDLLSAIEIHLITPLEDEALASELGIKPKRGILLAGPPGTGKTSIGRALAHRLKSKFFLIDGTFISDRSNFYTRVNCVFESAAANVPAIIFIDDTDVIFEGGETGLYRYLLTMLDGLESEKASRVCVMMTAMNVASLPPALIRSGRIELWLETKLPDEAGRAAILRDLVAKGPEAFRELHVNRLGNATDGLTGADLKRLFEDGKLLYAYDRIKKNPLREPTNYFLDAIETVRQNKQRYAEADAAVRKRRPNRTSYYDDPTGNDDDTSS